jgi:uncharacterized protein YuzE
MKIKFDQEVDILVLRFSEEKIQESDEVKPGVILDFDSEGNIVKIEILDVSKLMSAPFKLEYEVASA